MKKETKNQIDVKKTKKNKKVLDNTEYIVYNAFRCRKAADVRESEYRIGNGCTDGYLGRWAVKCIRNYKTEVYK